MHLLKTASLTALNHEAKKFAADLRGGEIIGLIGPLGAGKTTFVQFIAAALGVKEKITSPTFTLLHHYKFPPRADQPLAEPVADYPPAGDPPKGDGLRYLIHIDCYRLTNNLEQNWRELLSIGLQDWLNRDDTVIMIEWADRLPTAVQKKMTLLFLERK